MLTENLAREYWPDPARAIGRRIRESPKGIWREVIGIVGNEHDDGADQKATPTAYWPLMQDRWWGERTFVARSLTYVIRSPRVETPTFLKEVQQAIWSVNANLPVANVRLLSDIHAESMARTSFTLVMLGTAAGVALLLGLVGIYGVIAYSVAQRTREIGIRIALGAPHGEVRGMFVRHGLRLTGVGLAIGLVAAMALTRLMSSLLFGVSAVDPATFAAVAVALGVIALLASYLPARRASSVDPVEALRWE